MTENKYSWLGAVLVEVQNSGVEFANNVRSSASLALAQAQEAIIAKIEAEKAEARIDELEKIQTGLSAPRLLIRVKYIREYVKDRIKELKEEA